MRFAFLPFDELFVLVVDGYPFYGLVAEDYAEAERGRLYESRAETFREHFQALLVPQVPKRDAHRLYPLDLQARPDHVQGIRDDGRREAAQGSGYGLYEQVGDPGRDDFE